MSARVTGSGAIQLATAYACNGPDALGGTVTTAAHPGRVYPPFDIYELPPPGGAQGFLYGPRVPPIAATQTFDANASPSGFDPTNFVGTANNGSIYGTADEVMRDRDHTAARWDFEVPDPDHPICAATISTDRTLPPVESVYDGHPFNAPAPGDHSLDTLYRLQIWADGVMVADGSNLIVLPGSFGGWGYISFPQTRALHWALVYDVQLGGGGFDGFHFYGGIRLVTFSLWTRSVNEVALVVPGSGHRQ